MDCFEKLHQPKTTLRSATALVILLFVQVGVGIANVLFLAPVWLQIAHLFVADSLWILLVLASAELVLEPANFSPSLRSGLRCQRRSYKMNRSARIAICCAFVATAIVGGFSAGSPQTYELPSNEQVVGYLLQSVNWYRHANAEQQVANGPAGLIFLDDNRGIELQIVKLSFEFAKADATLETTAPSPHDGPTLSDPPTSDLAHFVELKNRNDQVRREAIQEVETLNKKIARAKNSERQELKAALEDAEGRLQLLEAFAQTIDDLIGFVESSRAGQAHAGTLDSTIDRLAQSIPEMNGPAVLSTTSPVPAADSRPVSGDTGILGLASDVSAVNRKLHVVDEKILLTNDLTLSAENLRNPMAAFVTRSIQSVATIDLQTSDLPSLREQKSHLDAVALELKGLSPAIVALDKQKVLLAEYKSNVLSLRTEIAGQYRQAWKKLVIRLFSRCVDHRFATCNRLRFAPAGTAPCSRSKSATAHRYDPALSYSIRDCCRHIVRPCL